MSTKTEFPLLKDQLMKDFGYISFQLALANVDVIGIRIRKSFEVVVITFSKATKTGFIYEGGNLTPEQVFKVFQDVPADRNFLEEYEENMAGKVEVLVPPKRNYVFVSDREVREIQPKK
ncbi:hypothetical protein L0B70_00320 [Kaistella sp. 97-N-M2]|uniref:hypothetical protein n=1 Tax=Kaistella sp. 97-N-M2 TaxID=2908645 RepID=UPI001F438F5F|nr:hypothetical protein [Kaistella sp. 97-N-M2]UJF29872.1 hypothetical protein L0B70_00320 [Kaistella sp. 97-N-M2]